MTNQSADAPISENQMEIKKLGVNIRLHNFPLPAAGGALDADATRDGVADDYDDGLLSSAIHKVINECNAEAARFVNVGQLREAIADLPDEMEVIMRVEGDEGASQMLAHVVSAIADAGCGEVEALMLDGFDSDIDFEEGTTVRPRVDIAPNEAGEPSAGEHKVLVPCAVCSHEQSDHVEGTWCVRCPCQIFVSGDPLTDADVDAFLAQPCERDPERDARIEQRFQAKLAAPAPEAGVVAAMLERTRTEKQHYDDIGEGRTTCGVGTRIDARATAVVLSALLTELERIASTTPAVSANAREVAERVVRRWGEGLPRSPAATPIWESQIGLANIERLIDIITAEFAPAPRDGETKENNP